MRICVLGSGSEGNCTIVSGSSGSIMIDSGFSYRQTSERLEKRRADFADISALILTHEHSDHIRGAGVIARKRQFPVFATEQTLLRGKPLLGNLPDVRLVSAAQSFAINGFVIHPFSISHDAADPIGLVIESDGCKAGICTDLGCVTHLVRQRLLKCNAALVEMNHDVAMLFAGTYPWPLKQRIRSNRGHLSNDQGGELIRDIWHLDLQHVILGHLSKENNMPDLALLTAQQAIQSMGGSQVTRLHTAIQAEPTEFIEIKEPSETETSSQGGAITL